MTIAIAAAAAAAIAALSLGWWRTRVRLSDQLVRARLAPHGFDAASIWRPGRPEAATAPSSCAIYRPGAFLVSAYLGAETWVVSDGERWALSYELDGTQRLAGWLDDADVPLEVRLSALSTQPRWEERP